MTAFTREIESQDGRERPVYLDIDAAGRLTLPFPLLQAAGLRPGDRVGVEADGGSLLVVDARPLAARLRADVRPVLHSRRSVVDELIADRRAEAAGADAECEAWHTRTGGDHAVEPPPTGRDD